MNRLAAGRERESAAVSTVLLGFNVQRGGGLVATLGSEQATFDEGGVAALQLDADGVEEVVAHALAVVVVPVGKVGRPCAPRAM